MSSAPVTISHRRFRCRSSNSRGVPQSTEELFVMASEAKILQLIARVASDYCRIEKLTYQTVMRSCYKPGKILLNARSVGTNVARRATHFNKKRSFPSEARSASLLFVRSHYLQRFSRALDHSLLWIRTILPGL